MGYGSFLMRWDMAGKFAVLVVQLSLLCKVLLQLHQQNMLANKAARTLIF